jgi:pyruvate kinase
MLETVYNRTKMVATLGPASGKKDILIDMIKAGLDVCRLNASHGDHAYLQQMIDLVQEVNKEGDAHVSTMLDLQGPKIRIGGLAEPYPIQPGQEIVFNTSIKELSGDKIPMVMETFAHDVKPGDMILVEDGKVELTVLSTNKTDEVRLKVVHGTNIGSRKGVNLPTVNVSLPSLTDKDKADVELAITNNVEWIALSFVRRAKDVQELKALLKARGSTSKIIAKIEKPEALKNLDEIIAAADAIMVARGDLGVEIPIEEVPFWQKKIIRKCNMAGRPVIVATQMMESMIENNRPTRAEATDVVNAVMDGADAVMVSGETSVGKHPVEVIRTMQKLIAKAEMEEGVYNRRWGVDPHSPTFYSDAICYSACKMAKGVHAKAIVSMTRSGYTAFQLSRHRPPVNIFIFTDNYQLLNTLSLVWGVRTYFYDKMVGTNETILEVIEILKKEGHVATGDVVVNTASMPLQSRGRTNMLKITIVE